MGKLLLIYLQGRPIPWPPRSPDLTPLDFYVWGRAKELVYAIEIQNVEDLRERIAVAFQKIQQEMLLSTTTVEIRRRCRAFIANDGGLDCTILAFLVDKLLANDSPIDLINIAFKKSPSNSYDVPDRITGRQSFEELKNLRPVRKWVFHEVNVPLEELEKYQKTTIADLVHPRQTILDESLGSALWFAARAKTDSSVSPCRVLLLGTGADELFGGYTRHKNAFKRLGWSGLHKELMLDWKRISFRNLARDNRVICDHGKQPRMPYLDEDFTEFVLNLKPWQRCFPAENLGSGLGDKLILRLVAFKLGLLNVSTFPKRALQFGSKIANKKEKGSDLSKNFQCTVLI
ncbi:Asparagine synthetase domain-containing protein CG17486 [Eumeta japonica]|uniref:Asparagine synthetase domain-containing protein CG17486 n=1 Tax=Eumeta variegata TaxID=151549 RepID=A0A4C1SVS4_EUMVA|nr:Asparagine synthetase domain-containing protein CG17486 [Eumeta japonica]